MGAAIAGLSRFCRSTGVGICFSYILYFIFLDVTVLFSFQHL